MAGEFDWLTLEAVEAAIPAMEATGAAAVARGAQDSSVTDVGFVEAYRAAKGKPAKMAKMHATGSSSWADRRRQFIRRHLAQMRRSDTHRTGFRPDGTPTKRMLGLIAWAYIPPESRQKAQRWYDEGCPVQVPSRRNEQASLFSERVLGIPVMHFASGSNHPAEIRGFVRLRKPVGVAAAAIRKDKAGRPTGWAVLCGPDCERELIAAARQGVPVFIDSGAFSEIEFGPRGPYDVLPIDHAEWLKRLALYERVVDGVGPQNAHLVNIVAPDKVADQRTTLARMQTYGPIMRRLREKGASVLVPLQKAPPGMGLTIAEFHDAARRALGFPAHGWVAAIPMKKDATTAEDLRQYLQARKPERIHLLGVGPNSPRTAEIAQAIRDGHPKVQVQGDSVLIRAVVGRQSGVKPLTAAQDAMRLEAAEYRSTGAYPADYRTREGFGLGDYTDALDDLDWLTATDRRNVAQALQLDRPSARLWRNDPTEASQMGFTVEAGKLRLVDDEDATPLYEHPGFDTAVYAAWAKAQQRDEVAPVKEIAIERVFRERGEGPVSVYRNPPSDARKAELRRAQILPVGVASAALARRLAEYPQGRAHRIGLRTEAAAVDNLRRMGWVRVVDTIPPEPDGPSWTMYDVVPTPKLYAAVQAAQRAREQYRDEFQQTSLFRRNAGETALFGVLPENPHAAKMTRKEREKDQDWFEVYGHKGAPKEGEKGYKPRPRGQKGAWGGRNPYSIARDVMDGAERFYDQPEARQLWYTYPDDPLIEMDWESEFRDADEFGDYLEHTANEFEFYLDLMNVPTIGPDGKPLHMEDRLNIARRALGYVSLMRGGSTDLPFVDDRTMRTIDPGKSRKGPANPKVLDHDDEGLFPRWAVDAIMGDLFAVMTPGYSLKLRLVDVDKATATRFIEKHHSALPRLNPRGLMYAMGVMKGDRLVAVATASTPSAKWAPLPKSWQDYREGRERWVDPRNVVELTRVASDGSTKGAASKLVARLMDLLPKSKRGDSDLPSLFVTYQLSSESGESYRALKDRGLRPVAFLPGKEPSGSRAGAQADLALARVDKIRWEYSPDPGVALPARWDLLNPRKRKRKAPKQTRLMQKPRTESNPRSPWDARNRPGSQIQTVLFDAGRWSMGEAKDWLRKHGFEGLTADRTAHTIRFRQIDPGAFRLGSFRTIQLDPDTGIQAVVGIPR